MIAAGMTVVLPIGSSRLVPQLVNCLTSLSKQRKSIDFPLHYCISCLFTRDDDIGAIGRVCRTHEATLVQSAACPRGGFETPRARNLGAMASPTEWLLFADSDLLFPPGALEKVGTILRNGRCVIVDVDDVGYGPSDPTCFELNWAKLVADAKPRGGAHGCLAVPRAAWAAVRGYDEGYRGWAADDQDFRERVERAGWHWTNTRASGVVVYHQWHARAAVNAAHTVRNRERFFDGRKKNLVDQVNRSSVGGYRLDEKCRMIGVIGEDHCGSTVLARLMASASRVATCGELHWLSDLQPEKEVTTRAGWKVARQCIPHGDECQIIDEGIRERPVSREELYRLALELWGEKCGAHYLVNTDKYPGIFAKFGEKGTILGIVLFKDPMAAVASGVFTNNMTPEEALNSWAERYDLALDWAETFCERVCWVEYRTLATSPERVLHAIWRDLRLTCPMPDGTMATSYCHIGGNRGAISSSDVALDSKHRRLDGDVVKMARDHADAQAVYRALKKRGIRL